MDLGTRTGERYRVVDEATVVEQLVQCGYALELRAGRGDEVRSIARAALERWVRAGLPFRRDGELRLFDICEVGNFPRIVGDRAWLGATVELGRRAVTELFPEPTAMRDGVYAPARFDVTLRRELNLRGLPAGKRLRLGVALPVADRAQDDPIVEMLVPAERGEGRVLAGRLDVRTRVPQGPAPRIEVGVRLGITVRQEGAALDPRCTERTDPAEHPELLAPDEGPIRVTPTVRALASDLADDDARPGEVVANIWRWFFDHMRLGGLHPQDLGEDDPLGALIRLRWADCYTGSALFAALCRARGIPARIVHGYQLMPVAPGVHYWVEAWLPPYGFLPFDWTSVVLADGDWDARPWRDLFFGRVDYRLRIARLPDPRVGLLGLRYPAEWYMLGLPCEGGTLVSVNDRATGDFLIRDRLQISFARLAEPSGA